MNKIVNIKKQVSNHQRILVLGDIHGNLEDFKRVLDFTKESDLFLITLGDLIDYGSNSLEVIKIVSRLISGKKCLNIEGNHENKFQRWLVNYKANSIKSNNSTTVNEYLRLNKEEKEQFEATFDFLYDQSPIMATFDNFTFVHGAVAPCFWDNGSFNTQIYSHGLYGQIDKSVVYPHNKIYNWVNYVPKDNIVIVGHDIRQKHSPYKIVNRSKGTVYYTDCGSSKGGCLCGIILRKNINDMYDVEAIMNFTP